MRGGKALSMEDFECVPHRPFVGQDRLEAMEIQVKMKKYGSKKSKKKNKKKEKRYEHGKCAYAVQKSCLRQDALGDLQEDVCLKIQPRYSAWCRE